MAKVHIKSLFGADLEDPRYVPERGEIEMRYRENDVRLDLSSSGRGLQQTLLVLSYMYANPGAVLLLDEPDAHLEILRQRQIYHLLTAVAQENNNQIIAASHSEVLLNEAAGKDIVVAFVGKPHRIDDSGSQVLKSLKDIGFEDYYQAEQTGWVLYLEGSTDLAIVQAFAKKLQYEEAAHALERPFVHYVGKEGIQAQSHFYGLREALRTLKGIGLFDRVDLPPQSDPGLEFLQWKRREIENYLCYRETLLAYAQQDVPSTYPGPLFTHAESKKRIRVMEETIEEVEQALATLKKPSPWSPDAKVTDDFLDPLFEKYFEKLGLPHLMRKKNYYELAHFVPPDKLDPEIREKLEAIVEVSRLANPLG